MDLQKAIDRYLDALKSRRFQSEKQLVESIGWVEGSIRMLCPQPAGRMVIALRVGGRGAHSYPLEFLLNGCRIGFTLIVNIDAMRDYDVKEQVFDIIPLYYIDDKSPYHTPWNRAAIPRKRLRYVIKGFKRMTRHLNKYGDRYVD